CFDAHEPACIYSLSLHDALPILHAKLTLTTTALLLVIAFLGLLGLEWSNPATLGDRSLGTKLLGAGFAAVMPRSGGFSTLDVGQDRKSTRLNSSHVSISYAVFCL